MDQDEFAGVPDNIRSLIEHVGFIDSEGKEPDVQELVDRFKGGHCMTCGAELGKDTVVLINRNGITAMYCGGACLSDMSNLGWLEEHYRDIVDQIAFRGGQVDADGTGE